MSRIRLNWLSSSRVGINREAGVLSLGRPRYLSLDNELTVRENLLVYGRCFGLVLGAPPADPAWRAAYLALLGVAGMTPAGRRIARPMLA